MAKKAPRKPRQPDSPAREVLDPPRRTVPGPLLREDPPVPRSLVYVNASSLTVQPTTNPSFWKGFVIGGLSVYTLVSLTTRR